MPDVKSASAKGGAATGAGASKKGGKNAAAGAAGAVPPGPPVELTEAQQIQLLIEDKAGEVILKFSHLFFIFYFNRFSKTKFIDRLYIYPSL